MNRLRSLAVQCVLQYLVEVAVYVVGTLALLAVAFALLKLTGVI